MKALIVFLFLFATYQISHFGHAQTVSCNGVLGSPIINFDFGQGNTSQTWYSPLSTYAPGLTTSTIVQANGPLPAANTSGLVKHTSAFGSAPNWLAIDDHTGNTNGLLFGINMPDNIGIIVAEYEMNGLCPNTTLEFSIWLANLMSPSHPMVLANNPNIQYPNMIMRIVNMSGAMIAEHYTGNVPTDGVWHQYAFLFANGNNTSLKLQLINNTQGSAIGNDVALDDITLRPCVPNASITPLLDTTLCQSSSLTFHAGISPNVFNSPEFQWQYSLNQGATWINSGGPSPTNSITMQFPTQLAPAEYWVRFLVTPGVQSSNTFCQASSDISKIRIDTIDHDFLNPDDTTICENEFLILDLSSTNAVSYSWSTGASTSSIIVNNSGQYFAEIRSLYGCKASDTINVTFKDAIPPDLGVDTLFCEGDPAYVLSVEGLNADHVLWSTGANTEKIEVSQSGVYWVRILSEGCYMFDTVTVNFNPIPIVDLGDDLLLCESERFQLGSSSNYPEAQYLWSTGERSKNIQIFEPGKYWLEITNLPNCIGSDTVEITLHQCNCSLFLPNAFSPNNDGINDVFIPKMVPEVCPHSDYIFVVFNRWGQLVFQTNDIQKGWKGDFNGKNCELGVYMYYIKFKETMTGKTKYYKGDITLMR